MKRHLFYLLFALLVSPFTQIVAQTQATKVTPDKRLFEAFSKQEINDMLAKQPEKIAYLNFSLENAYFISNEADGPVQPIKSVSLKSNSSVFFSENVNELSSKTFNYMKYNFKIDNAHYISYLLGNGKYLVFFPNTLTESKFNTTKNK